MLLASSWSAHAAGLGRLSVVSGLGQPFRAEIDLVSVQASEADSLAVSLASPEAFSNAQIPYPPTSLGLRFNIEKRGSGQYYVLVTSGQVVSEPFLDLLVDLNWATGRIQREYTALLDPVGYGSTGSASSQSGDRFSDQALPGNRVSGAVKAPRVSSKAKRAKAAGTTEASTTAEPSATPAAPSDEAAAGSYKVKSGDTLSSIANKVKPEGVNLEQVLVSLYKTNPDAFDGNMNRLKRGKILNVPDREQIAAVSKSEAAQEIRAQAENWRSYRSKLAEAAGKQPAAEVDDKAAAGKITAKVEDKGAGQNESNKDVLKLSKGSDAKGKKGTSAEQGKLQALEEEAAARQKSLDEANQRVTELQKNVRDMEKALAVKGKLPASAAATAKPTAEPTLAPVVETAASAVETASAVVAASAVEASAVAPVASEPVASKPRVKIAPTPVPVEEESFLDSLLANPLLLGGGLAAILAGVGGLIWARRRNRPGNFADSIITGGDLKPNTVLGNTGGAVISTQPTENSFLTDFSRQGLGTIDTDEVDPIAEAEVYMAYGRDAQAEEILRDALAKDPNRHEVRLKLLEIYSARKDKTAFEEIAADLYAQLNGQGPIWEQAAFMGRNIDPENPLYQRKDEPAADGFAATAAFGAGAAAAVAAAAPQELDFDLGAPGALDAETKPMAADDLADDFDLDLPIEAATPAPAPAPTASLDDDLGFDLDEFVVPGETPVPAPAARIEEPLFHTETLAPVSSGFVDAPAAAAFDVPADSDLDFSLDDLMPTPAPAPVAAPVAPAPAAALDEDLATDLDFDFALGDSTTAEPSPEAVEEALGELNLDDINLDLGDDNALTASALQPVDEHADFAGDDPVQTKIDLAKAYIDMGDVEGAREILQEAIGEGNAGQQQEARGLLDTL
ncbi:hypothetical protein IGB42_00083 [Andreprevotia sp. IGB-42]|uniref:FimV/HubP family polar landmark protein n=1 Tax=Andreprevotia sp. IGB-42 TaxID=2497473 RepID=UPI00135858DF|nr:FimV/HubP family polar landmark protein [Andreprevotia sp. IGB-42]KAF0815006.1 hypothetical protein IGB42_00083 [Andreprevotia sp. IGB-42]